MQWVMFPGILFNDVNALLIKPDSASDIADALLAFIKEPGKISSLGQQARKTGIKHILIPKK